MGTGTASRDERSAGRPARVARRMRWPAASGAAIHAVPPPPTRRPMLLTLAIILFIVWALGFLAFHVTMALIHILVVLAIIALILHFVRGRKSVG
jgi:hypothetical protein